ncbi:hypothetical protein Lupro_02395 [Lutibacter profundi]|uniref:Uncharacterized protein n=1 Tax=Lutibacter profundi TaxID=1622118 RepID=A0A0X8G4Z6_9FLAO|nr:hypothetical protein [Lutibacter profundi]AMC10168.1 hypothetical protein Lupro_02395 [Lutibacter profundi]
MKIVFLQIMVAFTIVLLLNSCSKDKNNESDEPVLVGMDGNPRFNLQFTNPDNVDLDLYVKTPSGAIISYSSPQADGGTLDVDCLCSDCPQGPTENIYWTNGSAPSGTYEYWVNYYDYCESEGAQSSFTLRVIQNGVVKGTKTGTMSVVDSDTEHWTFVQ